MAEPEQEAPTGSQDGSQDTDEYSSRQYNTLPPVRNLPAIRPRPERLSLPSLADVVSLIEARNLPIRSQSLPSRTEDLIQPLVVPGQGYWLVDGLPVRHYVINDVTYAMQKPPNETRNESTRQTQDGRHLKYTLDVLQQPARARACGNGPRASSDRRPVDPPPVVQLKVYDVTNGEPIDITMSYDSGFMLFASLETARPIATGRIHQPAHPPVLTGVCVASAAYLEKPKGPSGYFIFPDISVRHEGWYRIKFSLFEAMKHERDADHDRAFDLGLSVAASIDAAQQPPVHRQPIDHQGMANRLEVQSEPFQVFSAKKFPGLVQSTEVSKTLSEQGCRVRIRREIRQRKRTTGDEKPKAEGSSRASSEQFEHSRNQSMDSQYPPYHQGSVDSQYSRLPEPIRQHSITSLVHPSPTTMASPMAPPPSISQRYPYQPSPYSSQAPSYSNPFPQVNHTQPPAYLPNGSILPAIQTNMMPPMQQHSGYTPRAPAQYDLPPSSASKRRVSDDEYNDSSRIQAGYRPDTLPRPAPTAPTAGTVIEPDDDQSEDDLSAVVFRRPEQGRVGLCSVTRDLREYSVQSMLNYR